MTMDANWTKYDSLFRFRGAQGSTTFNDSLGVSSNFVASGGATTIISTAIADPFGESNGVLYVPGTYIVNGTSCPSLSGNFSFGAWLRFSSTEQAYFLCVGGTAYTSSFWMVRTSGVITIYAGSTALISVSYSATNEWGHINVSRLDGVVKLHINGVSAGTASSSMTSPGTGVYLNCRHGYYSYMFIGYMSHFYICAGDCLYWDDFTPPTVAVVSPSFSGTVADSTNNPVARTVNAHLRSTGALMGTTTSDETTGAFTVETVNTGAHYLVALDDDLNENALIFDNVIPT